MRDHARSTGGFVVQAGILAAAGIICKIIGVLYRAPLTAIIGDEGNGYYQQAYNVYTIVLLISSSSIPTAVSKVVSARLAVQDYVNAHRLFMGAMGYVLAVGVIASMVLLFGAPVLVKGAASRVLRVFAPTIFLYGILGTLRGYFQAHRSMSETSISQVLEQIANAAVSILAAHLFIRSGLLAATRAGSSYTATEAALRGACGSALGTGAGVLTALVVMTVIYARRAREFRERIAGDSHEPYPYARIIRTIAGVVLPFILSTALYNLTTFLDQTVYAWVSDVRWKRSDSAISTSYGIFSAKAVILSNIPIVAASSVSAAILPEVSAAGERGDMDAARAAAGRAVRVTMIVIFPCAVGLAVLAWPVSWLLFRQRESVTLAAKLLVSLAPSIVFYAISTLTNAVLQGVGRVRTPMWHAGISLAVQGVVLTALLIWTKLDLYALCIAVNLYSLTMCILNQISLRKSMGFKLDLLRDIVTPLMCSAFMGTAAFLVCLGLWYLLGRPEWPGIPVTMLLVAVPVIVGAAVYAVMMVRTGGITLSELSMIPGGRRIGRLLGMRILEADDGA